MKIIFLRFRYLLIWFGKSKMLSSTRLLLISLLSFSIIPVSSCGIDKSLVQIQWKAIKELSRKNRFSYLGFHHDVKGTSCHRNGSSFIKESRIQLFSYLLMKNDDPKMDDLCIADIKSKKKLRPVVKINKRRGTEQYERQSWQEYPSMEGVHIRVVSGVSAPAVTYIEDGCSSKDCFKGLFANVWHELSDKMNFTYSIKRANMWGSETNGSWNGMIGMLKNGSADIAVTDMTITSERNKVVRFLPQLLEAAEELYMKNPGYSLSTVAYIGSFTTITWFAIALWLIFVPLLLNIIVTKMKRRKTNELSIFECYIFVISSITSFGYSLNSSKTKDRIAFVCVLIGGMLIYTHWEGQLISHLAVQKTNFPFNNLKEFSQNTKYKLIVSKGTVYVDYFKNTDDPLRRKIWTEKIEPFFDQMPLDEELEEKILYDPYKVVYTHAIHKLTQAYKHCRIVCIPYVVRKTQLAFATREHFPFFEAFRKNIHHLKEVGLVQRYIKNYQIEKPTCRDYSGESITIYQCYIAFQVFVVGVLAAFIIFIMESCIPWRCFEFFSHLEIKKYNHKPKMKKKISHIIVKSRR